MIEWRDATVVRGSTLLVECVTLRIDAGELVVLAGPNGAGKSTLVRAMGGEWPLAAGRALIFGRDLGDWPRRELALRFAVLPQHSSLAFDFLVDEVVALGRFPHRGRSAGAADTAAVSAALAEVGLDGFGRRGYLRLSAGEQQRVHVARVLAQLAAADGDAVDEAMLLDEPTSALDLGQQQRLLDLLWRRARRGAAVGLVLHDLNLAARYADRLALLSDGRMVAVGTPGEVLAAPLLERVYGCEVAVRTDPDDGRPVVTLAGPSRRSAR